VFCIGGPDIPQAVLGGEPGDPGFEDINNALNSECQAADDILQQTETVLIGGSVWKVVSRSLPIWSEGQIQLITLQCVEILDSNLIDVTPNNTFQNTGIVTENRLPATAHCGTAYSPLTKVSFALIKNTRACDVTDICIRSQVWLRLNGICNFDSIPRPGKLTQFDKDNIALSTGTTTEYSRRSSVFTFYWRKQGNTNWIKSGLYFCVRGSTPVDQFNQLRLRHPGRSALEFRFIPIPAAITARFSTTQEIIWLQGGNTSSFFSRPAAGGVIAEGRGTFVLAPELELTPQLTIEGRGPSNQPTVEAVVTGVDFSRLFQNSNGEWITYSRAIFGLPTAIGQTKSEQRTVFKFNRLRSVVIRITVTSFQAPNGDIRWRQPPTVQVISSDTSQFWGINEDLFDTLTSTAISGSNVVIKGSVVSTVPENEFNIQGEYGVVYRITGIQGGFLISPEQRGFQRFETFSQISEVSHYGTLLTRSCDSSPEHSIVAVNEQLTSTLSGNPASYKDLTCAAVSIKSNRNFDRLDQLRLWIGSGIDNSNSFPRLVQYLLLNGTNVISSALIDTASINEADAFTTNNGFFFDGVIADRQNIRTYISSLAPFFLCNFVIANGRFSIQPALPLNTASRPISQIFTAGNIIEGSFSLEYLSLDQRKDFQALMTYRINAKNELPTAKSVLVRYTDVRDDVPIETFDMSAFCTSRDHAIKVARYFLGLRRRVTHSISFKTVPEGAGIRPGDLIKVAIEKSQLNSFNNGIINTDGSVVCATPLANGTYAIVYFKPGMEDVMPASLVISNGFTTQSELFGALFTLAATSISTNTYQIEQVELDEDGLVNVLATEYPVERLLTDLSGSTTITSED